MGSYPESLFCYFALAFACPSLALVHVHQLGERQSHLPPVLCSDASCGRGEGFAGVSGWCPPAPHIGVSDLPTVREHMQ